MGNGVKLILSYSSTVGHVGLLALGMTEDEGDFGW